jgi:multidrug efflux system outer membrane protein
VLHRLVNTGLKNNFDIRIAYARIEEARANFKVARGQQWPAFDVGSTGGWRRLPVPNGGGNTEYSSLNATAGVSWEIDVWGRLRRAKEAARANLFAQEAYKQSVRLMLVNEIVSSYFNLLEYDNEMKITKENIVIRQKSLDLVKAKLIAGTASGLVVAQAEAELALAKTSVPRLEMLIGMEENYLSTLLGMEPRSINRGLPMLEQMNLPGINTPGLTTDLITRRPDIIMAEQTLVAANANIGVARAMMLPTIGITANVGAAFMPTTMIYSALGNLVAPIFQGGKLRANVKIAEAQKEQMLYTYQKTIVNSLKEVSDALLQVQKLREIVVSQETTAKAAQTAYELSDQLYNAGYASYLDVINTQSMLFEAQVALSQAQSDELTAMVNLYTTLGGGWK